jgi:hypothetical protein
LRAGGEADADPPTYRGKEEQHAEKDRSGGQRQQDLVHDEETRQRGRWPPGNPGTFSTGERDEGDTPCRAVAVRVTVQPCTQLLHRSRKTFAYCRVSDSIERGDLRRTEPIEVTAEHGGAVRLIERHDSGNQTVLDFPARKQITRALRFVASGNELSGAPTRLGPDDVLNEMACDAGEPATEVCAVSGRSFGRREPNLLRDIVCGGRIGEEATRERTHPRELGEQLLGEGCRIACVHRFTG